MLLICVREVPDSTGNIRLKIYYPDCCFSWFLK